MNTGTPIEDEPSREYIADTWGWKQDGASWIAHLEIAGGDASSLNHAIGAATAGLLDDFALLGRVRSATILTIVADDEPIRLSWEHSEPYALFRERLLNSIREYGSPVTSVKLGLDVRAWIHAKDSPLHPERGWFPELAWISYPGTVLELFVDDSPWVEFELDNTLFSAFTYPDKDPNPLHPFNQPLLEAALRRFRARSIDPLDRYGELSRSTHEFGFSSDPDDY